MKYVELEDVLPTAEPRHAACSIPGASFTWGMLMATPTNRSLARPAKDEWGVYDPQQAGLAALFQRLDTDGAQPTSPASRLSMRPAAVPTPPPQRDSKK
jgi:hypothetical protein